MGKPNYSFAKRQKELAKKKKKEQKRLCKLADKQAAIAEAEKENASPEDPADESAETATADSTENEDSEETPDSQE